MAKYNFEEVFAFCRTQPVDSPLEVFTDPYEVLISTVMSARTNDDTTLPAAKRLFTKAPDFKALSNLPEVEIATLIFPVGFYKTKAKNIKKLAENVIREHEGKVPSTLEGLTSLPGVGIKTANLVLNRAFDVPAICVDTHVHKISNLLGWVNTKTPEQTEKELSKILPKEYWNEINTLFVSLGRQQRTIKKVEEVLRENGLISA
jgi:endonuclease-3